MMRISTKRKKNTRKIIPLCCNLVKEKKMAARVNMKMIKNKNKISSDKKKTNYHFEEEDDDMSNDRKKCFLSKQENNDGKVDAIMIRNIMKSKDIKKRNNFSVKR